MEVTDVLYMTYITEKENKCGARTWFYVSVSDWILMLHSKWTQMNVSLKG